MRMSSRLGRVFLLAVLVGVTGGVWAGPAQASFPGPGGRIAFADFNTGQLYSINPDGTSLRQLTNVPTGGFAGQPDWSPDARRIAFTGAVPNGEARLYVMDRDGSHPRRVFSEQPGFGDFLPAYTPDASRLIFQRCETDTCAIYSVRVDGTQLRALTRFQQSRNVFDIEPTVSPDGATIAFARINAGGIASQIYVMRSDGSGAHPITPAALEGYAPDWTPDGRHLL
ncbi:MAG: TolB family protein, partial [Geodermatophilaceae bacterium]